MKTENVSIVSIRPDPSRPLGLDVKDILTALHAQMPHWRWCVRNLDWLGENADTLCRIVEQAGPGGHWMDSQDLQDQACRVYQTIEGEFLAFPLDVEPSAVTHAEMQLSAFPESRAELAIVAVDGGFFEVYTKDADIVALLRQFRDVRDEDAKMYF